MELRSFRKMLKLLIFLVPRGTGKIKKTFNLQVESYIEDSIRKQTIISYRTTPKENE